MRSVMLQINEYDDDKLCVNNYTPISVLSVFCKILERLVYDRLFFGQK